MSIVRFRPFQDLSGLQREMNRVFEDFFPARRGNGDDAAASAVWRPMVDVHENEHAFTVDAELPGMKKEDVKISFQDGTLTIAGERKYEKEDKSDENCQRMERFYGKFYRTFGFSKAVDADRISAKFEDGILRITLPKTEEVKPKQIEIS